jgi:hypothetical protein
MTGFGPSKQIATALLSLFMAIAGAVAATASAPGAGGGPGRPRLRIEGSASTAAPLYPGASGDVTIEVSNRDRYAVTITGVAIDGTSADIAADVGHPGCTTTGVVFTDQERLSIRVPAASDGADGTARTTLKGAVAMSDASVNGCQGAAFSIPVTVSAAAA